MKPQILQDAVALGQCLGHAPGFVAVVLGPVPFGAPPQERVRLDITGIIVPTKEEAEAACWEHVYRVCAQYGHTFDSDEWEIVHLQVVNTC